MSRVASRFLVAVMATLLATGWLTARPSEVQAVSPDVVISQVYGGGGNIGATYTNDFIELYNRGGTTLDVTGWSVQYASATGTSWQVTVLDGQIPTGRYYLVQQAAGAGGTTPLPIPDVTGSTFMSATSGKVALVTNSTALSCTIPNCDIAPSVRDFVGYGSTANDSETAPTANLTNTTAALRANGGATDTDNNAADFSVGLPRNCGSDCSAAPNLSINDVSANEANSGTTTFSFLVSLSAPAADGGVSFDIATADNTATVGDNDFVASSLAGQTIPEGSSTYQFDVTVNGDTDAEGDETFFVNVTNVSGAVVADGQGTGTILDDETCAQPATPISAVQGSGSTTPMAGSVVTIQGLVVGDYQGTGQFGGYYVQEEDADVDADPNTSEGIFVFNTATPVGIGAQVRVRGTAGEFSNLTQLSGVTSVLVCSTGNAVSTTPVAMPVTSIVDWERYEGMQVTISEELTVTELFTLARFGEVSLSVGGRLRNPTNVVAPGAPAIALQDLNARSRILLDDGNNQQNIDPTFYPQGGLSAANTLRVGDSLPSLSGVLDQRFGAYRVQPIGTTTIIFDHANPRSAAPDSVGGDVQIASFNVLNYFNGDGLGGGFPTSRGANTLAEFNRQREKIISAIDALDADIIGLMEIENDDPATEFAAIEDLVAGLNAAAGAGTYAFVDTGIVGTDAIRVGLLYRPAVVTPAGSHAIIDSTVDPRFIDTKNRPSLAQTFDHVATGARFTVVVNHLKSKGSSCDDVGDPDTGDGQGNCNGTRTLAAEALVDWLATDPTGSGDPDFLLIGDMNAYAAEDPIAAFESAGYTNTIATTLGDEAYSFVFQGQSGYLDHALASPSLNAQLAGVTEWHINADEPVALDYNVEFKTPNQVTTFYAPDAYRSSDHDPVLVGFELDAPPTIQVAAGGSCARVGGTILVTVGDLDTAPGDLALSFVDTSNATLVPSGNVTLGGSGANRTITIAATPKTSGTAVLTFSLSDGVHSTVFMVTVQVGTGANETLNGTSGADLLLGLAGSDMMSGHGGGDLLCGGGGQDALTGGDGDDTLDGERGNDVLSGGNGNDVLRGGLGRDSLSGDNGDDTLTGGFGADSFSGGAGTDTNADLTSSQGDTWDGT